MRHHLYPASKDRGEGEAAFLENEQNVSSPLTFIDSVVWGASVIKIWRSRFQIGSDLNHVSGGQYHLTVLKRFSWPSLAYMCTREIFAHI